MCVLFCVFVNFVYYLNMEKQCERIRVHCPATVLKLKYISNLQLKEKQEEKNDPV